MPNWQETQTLKAGPSVEPAFGLPRDGFLRKSAKFG
jgi:hypothetical protein